MTPMASSCPSSGVQVLQRTAMWSVDAHHRLHRVTEDHIYGAGDGRSTGRVVRLATACCSAAGLATSLPVRHQVARGGRKTKRHSVAATSWAVQRQQSTGK
ncbi:unnamed protein product [Urochloa humidicola]